MDLAERVERRRSAEDETGPVASWRALDPTAHLDEPIDRGEVVERVLDTLSPVFDGRLPEPFALHGPPGSGKSAVVTAVMAELDAQLGTPVGTVHTTTRAASAAGFRFVYVDARYAPSRFQLYRALLSSLTDEHVPERGIGTDALADRLQCELAPPDRRALLALDHVGEPRTPSQEAVETALDPLPGLSWFSVGRGRTGTDRRSLPVASYDERALADVLAGRAERGLAGGADQDAIDRLAAWADGNAHDGLCALYCAAIAAENEGARRVTERHLTAGRRAVPSGCIALGQVRSLPRNRRRVLDALLSEGVTELTIEEAATRIGERTDLSPGTVKRFLYELAEYGVLARVRTVGGKETGRTPSRVEPCFPIPAFHRLVTDSTG
ncbi:Cdc6/Cdc18 family protein [Natronorarus salvus]|uniref:Cdc6/Cdc18 family protein n=1 Tax=Natronorarus salvus TaxID=3117733 RepID=UPI002F269EBA